jgi:hypothetical protein
MAAARRPSVSQSSTRDRRGGQAVSRTVGVAEEDDGEEPEPKPGFGLPDAMVFATTALLLAAIVVTDYWLGKQFGEGMFFK